MIELTRTVRFTLRGDGVLDTNLPVHNGFAGWPPAAGLGRYYELHVTCAGQPDPQTGYFINIKLIDRAVRENALPLISRFAVEGRDHQLGELLRQIVNVLDESLNHTTRRVDLQLTPTVSLSMEGHAMDHVSIRQQYEFSAAHRLHVPDLSDDENRTTFGKCNNPAGHGHNYRIEVEVRAPIDEQGRTLDIAALDACVDQQVIEKLDHKNLGVDVPQFQSLNTSVENISRIIYEMLSDPIHQLDAELAHIRVWETGKTSCTYPG